ncbi:MAG: Hsp20/alpha crystallin family protein [Bacteroidota bacterium]|nr:Hsp20/alpha crystallin family protein [Bacteroidota bacterium]
MAHIFCHLFIPFLQCLASPQKRNDHIDFSSIQDGYHGTSFVHYKTSKDIIRRDVMVHFRIDPMRELEDISRRMKRFIEELPEAVSIDIGKGFCPRVDVWEDRTKVFIDVEIPGIPRENMKLVLKDDVLIISGVKPPHRESAGMEPVKTECMDGPFERRIPLPCEVERENISASLSEGVLRITLEKSPRSSSTEVQIRIQ